MSAVRMVNCKRRKAVSHGLSKLAWYIQLPQGSVSLGGDHDNAVEERVMADVG